MIKIAASFWMVLIVAHSACFSQTLLPYRNPDLPVEERVHDLLKRMTPEEKFRQLFMIPGDLSIGKERLRAGIFGFREASEGLTADAAGQMLRETPGGSAAAMAARINETQRFFVTESRLGIPVIQFDEALHGLTREGATSFPQAIALAATFDTPLMHRVSGAIADETRSRGIRQVLSPVLNLARDVRWGRTEETYGEDPFLIASMGQAFITEFEKRGVVTTPKHFAVNVGDGGRDSYPIHYNERLMEELYLPAFETAIRKAGARSLMTAYNSFDGSPCTASDFLLNRKVKKDWQFRGFIISDACAVGGANVLHYTASGYAEAGERSVENGLDVIFQTDFSHIPLFEKPFLDGSVPHEIIDSAVSRVLRVKFELGLFERPYADTAEAARLNGSPDHRALAAEAARKSIVLLKNEGHTLPIPITAKKIAVIGTDAVEARPGGYSGPGNNKISILDGLRQSAPDGVDIAYAPGCGRSETGPVTVESSYLSHRSNDGIVKGLRGEFFTNITLSGPPVAQRTDETIDFGWTLYPPDPALSYDWYSARWTGMITGKTTGECHIGMEGNDGFRLWLDGRLLIDKSRKVSFGRFMAPFRFEKGKTYDLRIEYVEPAGNARFKLIWDAGVTDTSVLAIRRATELAKGSDLAIVVVGIEEGEFRDRSSLSLPGRQAELIRAVAATGTPVAVLISGGSAVTMDEWIDRAGAVAMVWYPGEAGGRAIADVLFGRYNPAGRLPITFPRSVGQLPLVYNHKPTGRGDDYLDLSGTPLFPFGYGLSYTTFEYGDLRFEPSVLKPGSPLTVRFTVKNNGSMAGDEVCQVYLHDELATVARPVKELKGFRRIHLQPGETTEMAITLPSEAFTLLDAYMQRVTEPGNFRIMVGSSSTDIRLRGIIMLNQH